MDYCRNIIYNLKDKIYNYLISSYTRLLYRSFLLQCDKNNSILDVGIGNAKALCDNKDIIQSKNLKIFGIDIDENSIKFGLSNIKNKELDKNIDIQKIDLFQLKTTDYELFIRSSHFDYIYFSNSYSVIPEPVKFLKFSLNFCKNCKNLIISQTLFNYPNSFYNYLKPIIKYFVFNIDFGRYLTHKQLNDELENENLEIYQKDLIVKNKVMGIKDFNIFNIKIKIKEEVVVIPVEKGIFLEKNNEVIRLIHNTCKI
jgi:SAM-dependent methyltransferase